MARKGRARLRALAERVSSDYPGIDATAAIIGGQVRVNGRVITNPRSIVRHDASIKIGGAAVELRGEAKLETALRAFGIDVRGRVALDLGASTGGFTRVLRREGAERVYAVDVGFGQLLGSLRQDAGVVNLERTNLGELTKELVPDDIAIVTADLTYVSLASALPQLNGRVSIASGGHLIALVKPMYELRRAEAPRDADSLRAACQLASEGAVNAGWTVERIVRSPITGRAGAIEFLMHGRWNHGHGFEPAGMECP